MEIPGLQMAPVVAMAARPVSPQSFEQAAAQTESMVFEMFLRQAGLFQMFSTDQSGEGSLVAEMMLPILADHLAKDANLGLARLMLAQQTIN